MPRWAGHGQSETRLQSEGDARFTSLDMTRDRALLQPGTLAVSQNKRLINGKAATRPGILFLSDFNPAYQNTLVGSGVFSNPNGGEMLLVAEQNASFVWALQFGKAAIQIPISTGTLNASNETGILDCTQVKFVQAFDHVYLLRRPNTKHSTLVWDGTLPPSGTAVFTPVTQQPGTPTGSVMIPGGVDPVTPTQVYLGNFCPWDGEPFAERIILYNDLFPNRIASGTVPDKDTIVMTDTDRWDSYNPVQDSFRINSGESNVLTRILGYYRGAVLCFFQRGVHILENFTNPSVSVGDQRQINNFLGATSPEAEEQIGVDVYFLSEPGRGVYRISEAVQDQIAVNPLAVSDPIQPFIDSINWSNAQFASIKTLGVYVYVAVPVGTLAGNTQVAVFNQYSREWESIDTFSYANFSFQEMHVLLCGGQRQLIAVDWIRKMVFQMYTPGVFIDQIGPVGSAYPIFDTIESRGYALRDPDAFKRFERTNMSIETFQPSFYVQSISDGFNEVKLLTKQNVTKDRLRNYIHGKQFFTPGVSDPTAPKRQDYAVNPPTNYSIEDFELLPVGPINSWPGQNVSVFVGTTQQTLERFQIRQNGRWSSIRHVNQGGVCNILSINVEGFPTQEGIRTLA